MSILSRYAVQRGPPYTFPHCSRQFLSVPTNVYQPGLLGFHTFTLHRGSPLAYSVLGRQSFSSRKISKPPKRAEALKPPRRECHDHNKLSSKEIGPFWAGVAVFYAAFTVITWCGASLLCLTLSEKTSVTGRRRFAYFSAPSTSGETLSKELKPAFDELEEIQSLFGPLSSKVRQVFMDIAVAAGLDDREWKVYIIPNPGQSHYTHKHIMCVIFAY